MHAHIHADGVDRPIHARRGYRLSSLQWCDAGRTQWRQIM